MASATCSGIQSSGTLTKLISSDAANNESHASIKIVSASSPGLTAGIAMSQTSAICGNNSFFIRKSTAIFSAVQGLPPFPGRILSRGVIVGRAKQQAQAVPRPVTAAVAGAAAEAVPYTVQQGDTLWYLAERFHTSVEALLTLNGIADRDLVLERSVLLIPSPREASEDVASPAAGGGERGLGREVWNSALMSAEVQSDVVVDVGQVEDGMAASEEATGEGLRGGEQWSAGHEVRERQRPRMPSATTCGVVAASLLALGVILLAINTAERRLMRRQPMPYREQKRNTERIALTNSRFRSALSIDRATRPASARATRGGSEGGGGAAGEEAVTDTGVDLTPEVAMATIRRDREEAWALYGGGMEQSYESFLRDCGARKAGRFQGGMPSKFKDRSKR